MNTTPGEQSSPCPRTDKVAPTWVERGQILDSHRQLEIDLTAAKDKLLKTKQEYSETCDQLNARITAQNTNWLNACQQLDTALKERDELNSKFCNKHKPENYIGRCPACVCDELANLRQQLTATEALVERLRRDAIVEVWSLQAYGTPGKPIGHRCVFCNHDAAFGKTLVHSSDCELLQPIPFLALDDYMKPALEALEFNLGFLQRLGLTDNLDPEERRNQLNEIIMEHFKLTEQALAKYKPSR